jgi:hypothetical protein
MNGYHLRLEHTEDELQKAMSFLKDISGVCVIRHLRGKKGEHPHLHVWYPLEDKIKSEAFYERLKKHSSWSGYYGNKNWRVKPFDLFDRWFGYSTNGNKGQVLEINNTGLPLEITKVPIVAQPEPVLTNNISYTTVKPNRKKPMKVQFVNYLQEEEKWVIGERFRSQHAWDPKRVYAECAKQCSVFWEDAFTVPEGERMVRHAAYKFSDDALRAELTENTFRAILKRIMG